MSCEDSFNAVSRYHYGHNESATIRVYPSPVGPQPWSLNARVFLESTSTLRASSPIFHNENKDGTWKIREDAMLNGTPFSSQVLDLLSRYPLLRLKIRIGDAAASSGGIRHTSGMDEQSFGQEQRGRGPSGTLISASFVRSSKKKYISDDSEAMKFSYQNKYSSLLRYLLDDSLFPPCGAPLDSLRVRKHGHSVIARKDSLSFDERGHSVLETVNVESILAADAALFCNPGIQSFILSPQINTIAKSGWGPAASNGACLSNDTMDLFSSLFSKSSGEILSSLLLGTSRDSHSWTREIGETASKRNSVWIELQVSSSCFASIDDYSGADPCSLSVTRGVSYRVTLPSSQFTSLGNDHEQTILVSLGDLLVGHHTQKHSLSSQKENMSAWVPCPMSDSSKIVIHLPQGYLAKWDDVFDPINASGFDHSRWHTETMELSVFSLRGGFVDLAIPLLTIAQDITNENAMIDPPALLYGVSRTVNRPSGIASSGTLISVLRYDALHSDTDDLPIVKAQSLDVLPGSVFKPRMRSLRMTLYQGGGAGGERFVPPIMSNNYHCNHPHTNETDRKNDFIDGALFAPCGSVLVEHVSLSQLQDHKLTLDSDGTILLERTIFLRPDSSLWMMVDFDEAYFPFQKFPADANRGVDIFPFQATFTPVLSSTQPATYPHAQCVTLFSPSLIILPPVPDMSMPFNVISLSCTLWAFVLGSLLNTLVRRGTESVKRELTGEKEKRPIDKLRDKLKEKIGKLKGAVRTIIGNKRLKPSTSEAEGAPPVTNS